jgi:hypothetical protein
MNTTVATSLHGADLGLSFGGAGFLIFYYLGKSWTVHASVYLRTPLLVARQQQM